MYLWITYAHTAAPATAHDGPVGPRGPQNVKDMRPSSHFEVPEAPRKPSWAVAGLRQYVRLIHKYMSTPCSFINTLQED